MNQETINVEESPPSDGGPFHVLMAMATPAFMPDTRMKRDYISKRFKAFGNNNDLSSPWDGVSRIEFDLIDCCEKMGDDQDTENNHPGALQIDKEVQFAGLLARDCHSMNSRCLAMAILERTLEAYLSENEAAAAANRTDNDEWYDMEAGQDSNDRSERARKRQKLMNQKKEKESFDEWEVTRLEQFLAAGGLKLLNRWLVEASNLEPTVALKAPPGSNTKQPLSQQQTMKQPTTRPLIIPILRFLEKIPFDRKVIVESKINKQIRKLGQLIDGILEARARGKHRPNDLENWTTEPVTSETDALDKVKEAVEAVKASWEDKAKHRPETFSAPFEPIKKAIREKFKAVQRYEAGGSPKPDWLENEEPNKEAKKRTNAKKTKTQHLAAKERKAEREGLKNRLHAAENEHRERLAKLREQLRKLKQENAPSLAKPSVNNGKKVVWKDGMRSQTNRNRDLLEDVRIYIKNTPASDSIISADAAEDLPDVTDLTPPGNEEENNNLTDQSLL